MFWWWAKRHPNRFKLYMKPAEWVDGLMDITACGDSTSSCCDFAGTRRLRMRTRNDNHMTVKHTWFNHFVQMIHFEIPSGILLMGRCLILCQYELMRIMSPSFCLYRMWVIENHIVSFHLPWSVRCRVCCVPMKAIPPMFLSLLSSQNWPRSWFPTKMSPTQLK